VLVVVDDQDARHAAPDILSCAAMVELHTATVELIDQALTGDAALAEALGFAVAPGWSVWPQTLAQTRAWLAERPGLGDWGTKLIVVPEPRTLVGLGGFRGPPEDGVVEIGYALAESWRGRGLATAAARLMIAQAFADARVEAVIAHTLAMPNPSTRVLERLGFVKVRDLVDPDEGPVWMWRLERQSAR
jgi:RimJ/RimL family protein N-acetyltransferase